MAVSLESVMYLVVVALFWGATNPLIKKGAVGIENVKASSAYRKFFKEIYFLVTTPKYIIPFLVNQSGSLLFVMSLQNADLSLAVPVTNSLTFVFTAITGWILGEEKPHKHVYLGILLILAGTTICCLDKMDTAEKVLS